MCVGGIEHEGEEEGGKKEGGGRGEGKMEGEREQRVVVHQTCKYYQLWPSGYILEIN